MATSLAIRYQAEPIRTVGFGSIGASYIGIGGVMQHPIRQIYLLNLTNISLMFSFDGIDDHLVLPTQGYWFNDITSNKTREDGYYLAEGQRIYVKQLTIAPASGSVYLSVFYGANN